MAYGPRITEQPQENSVRLRASQWAGHGRVQARTRGRETVAEALRH